MKIPFRKSLSAAELLEQERAEIDADQKRLTQQFIAGTAPADVVDQMGRLAARMTLNTAALEKARDDERAAADAEAVANEQRLKETEIARKKSAFDAIRAQGRRMVKAAENIEMKTGAIADEFVTYFDARDKINALLPEGVSRTDTMPNGERLYPLLFGFYGRWSPSVPIGREFARAAYRRNTPLEDFPGANAEGIDPDKLPPLSHTAKQMASALVSIGKAQLIDPPKTPEPHVEAAPAPKPYRPARREPIFARSPGFGLPGDFVGWVDCPAEGVPPDGSEHGAAIEPIEDQSAASAKYLEGLGLRDAAAAVRASNPAQGGEPEPAARPRLSDAELVEELAREHAEFHEWHRGTPFQQPVDSGLSQATAATLSDDAVPASDGEGVAPAAAVAPTPSNTDEETY